MTEDLARVSCCRCLLYHLDLGQDLREESHTMKAEVVLSQQKTVSY